MSLGTKTLLSHFSLAIAIIAMACVLSYALSNHYIRRTRMADLVEKARRIASNSRITRNGDFRPSGNMVRTIEGLTNARVFFLDSDTEIVRDRKSVV